MIDSSIDNDEFIDAQYLKKNKTNKIVIIFTSTIWQIFQNKALCQSPFQDGISLYFYRLQIISQAQEID